MFVALLLACCLVPFPAQQDEEEPAGPAPDRGWALTSGSDGERWHARSAQAAFVLGADEALDPRLDPVGWSARYEADVELARLGQYSFAVEAEGGRARISVGGAESPTVDGALGRVRVVLSFEHVAGPARLQLRWKLANSPQGDFGWEPVPSRVVTVPPELAEELRAADLALRGRVLLEEKGCTNCHVPQGALSSAVGRRRAPTLGPERSFGAVWLARWIAEPAAAIESPDMPALGLSAAETESVVAWLASQGTEGSPIASEAQVLSQGRALYHQLGCVACHGALESPAVVLASEFLSDEVPALPVPAPRGELSGKWSARALALFLRDPQQQHTDARMPSLNLDASQADLLATYLLSCYAPAPAAPARNAPRPAVVERCAACHKVEGLEGRPGSSKTLAELVPGRGCLDPDDARTPRYALGEEERRALELGLREAQRARAPHAPLDQAERAYQKYRCGACHARDGRGGVPEPLRPYFVSSDERVDIGDEGRLPPDLSGVGFRLTTHWLGEMIARSGRARPYLAARMPQFPLHGVGVLAHDLARREGVVPESDAAEPAVDDAAVQTGRALMGRGAHACISCHLYQDAPSGGTPGPRLDQFVERLRYEWYAAYMPDPARFKPGTRMPSFQTRGTSAVRSVLGGDFHAQSDAMWSYFTLGGEMPPPPDLDLGGSRMRVAVGERPVVLRAFLAGVGPRAIAVGMPSGLHFGYDAGSARLADLWKGEFLDAGGAWAGRGGNELGGLGPIVWKAPPAPLLLVGKQPESWPALAPPEQRARFHGYELDTDGLPTFLWSFGAVEVRETIRTTLAPRALLRRELRLAGLRPGAILGVNRGTGTLSELAGLQPFSEHRFGDLDVSALSVLVPEVSFVLEVLP